MGLIPDWHPIYYQPDELVPPHFVPDTLAARRDLAAQYTTISRLDQGIALILRELENAGVYEDTLIIYSSDNGIPFPNGRTNLYDSGINVPMLIASGLKNQRRNEVTYSLSSLLDVVPTILDWFGIESNGNEVGGKLTGRSLLPLLTSGNKRKIFSIKRKILYIDFRTEEYNERSNLCKSFVTRNYNVLSDESDKNSPIQNDSQHELFRSVSDRSGFLFVSDVSGYFE